METLRVWERRYNIVGPRQSAKGQRLYSPNEVTRLTLIKKLVNSGYAIGSIAALHREALQLMLDEAIAAIAIPLSPKVRGKRLVMAQRQTRRRVSERLPRCLNC